MIDVRWQKVLGDLWQHKTRSLLVILSIAVGVFAVGSTASIQVNLQRDLKSSYEHSNPKSVLITAAPFEAEVVEAARQLPEVKAAEGRTALSVRVPDGKGVWKPFELVAIPDFAAMRIDTVYPAGGAWPPGSGEILLERASLPYLPGARQGETLQLQMPDTAVKELRITGLAYDAGRFPAPLSGVPAGYVSMVTLARLGERPSFNQLLVTVSGDQRLIRQAADRVQDEMRSRGAHPTGFYLPPLGKHIADSAVTTLMLLLGTIGAASLLLSGFLIHNTISAVLFEQIREIGAMKAIGATRSQLIGIYLFMTLVLCVAAFLLALPATWIAAEGMVSYLGRLLNAERVSHGLPPAAVLLQFLVALVLPLLSALPPVLAGTRVTVREALSAYRDAPRRLGRQIRTVLTLGLAGAAFIGVAGVQRSLTMAAREYLHHDDYDLAIRFEQPQPKDRVTREAVAVLGSAPTGTWLRTGVTIRDKDGTPSPGYRLIALPSGFAFLHPQLMEGRWLEPGDTDAVVIDHTLLSSEPGLRVGSRVQMKANGTERTWQVVGIVKGALTDTNLYVSEPYFAELAGLTGLAGDLLVQLPDLDATEQQRLGEELLLHFNRQGLRVGALSTAARTETMIMTQFNLVVTLMLAMSLLLALVGGIGLTGTLSINVLERTREIGIRRAIGASDNRIFLMVTVEAVMSGLAGWGVGTLLSVPLTRLLAESVGTAFLKTPLPYSFSLSAVIIWFGIVLVLSVSASLLPAWRATRVWVREALACE
ncbi:MAG TPA: ABC transporter permease [Symbiobacteriaceae bacterium]|jgi:putative ABC transport system permease protein